MASTAASTPASVWRGGREKGEPNGPPGAGGRGWVGGGGGKRAERNGPRGGGAGLKARCSLASGTPSGRTDSAYSTAVSADGGWDPPTGLVTPWASTAGNRRRRPSM